MNSGVTGKESVGAGGNRIVVRDNAARVLLAGALLLAACDGKVSRPGGGPVKASPARTYISGPYLPWSWTEQDGRLSGKLHVGGGRGDVRARHMTPSAA